MTPRRKRLLLGLAAAHLAVVALGARAVDLRRYGPIGRLLDRYSALSGADTGYGFFAPGVRDQLEATFEILDRDGNRTPATLLTGSSQEADLDVAHLPGKLDWSTPESRRAAAASLAAKVFARHPEAIGVVIRIDCVETVSMEEARSGAGLRRSTIYTAELRRGERGAPGGAPWNGRSSTSTSPSSGP